jgi:putative transposase
MRRGRFTEDQIIGVLREHEAGVKTADLCRKHRISDASTHKGNIQFGAILKASSTAVLVSGASFAGL